MDKEMTARRKQFIHEYLVDYNGTQAAIRAGYAVDSAAQEASRLLRNVKVKKSIAKRQEQLLKEISENQFRTAREIQRIALFDIRKLYDEQGNLKPVSQWDDDSAAAVAGVETVKKQDPDEVDDEGKPVWIKVLKIRTHDKVRAQELLGRHQGFFNDTLNIKTVDTGVIYLPRKVPVGAPVEIENEG